MGSGPVEIFLSYSRKDEELLRELERHLAALRREGKIATWKDRMLEAGADWEPELRQRLESAHVILLLISSDFLASEFCWSVEMAAALSRHEAGNARVIPIILRTCDWRNTALGKLQVLPEDGRPIRKWPDLDDAFFDVVQGIRKALVESVRFRSPPANGTSKPSKQARSTTPPLAAAKPPRGILLRPELGVHSGAIRRIAVDVSERFLVTGSHDNTVRIWDPSSGELLSVLRPQLGAGNAPEYINCVAIDPAASTIVASSSNSAPGTSSKIYFFDLASGLMVRSIGDLSTAVYHLTFSPDGRRLAVSCKGPDGIRILDSQSGRQLFAGLPKDSCYRACYFPGGDKLAAEVGSRSIHLYSADLKLLASKEFAGDHYITCIDLSPDGDEIAVTHSGGKGAEVVSARDLLSLYKLEDTKNDTTSLMKVSWAPEGKRLFSIENQTIHKKQLVRSWERKLVGLSADFLKSAGNVTDFLVLSDSRLACVTDEPRLIVLSSEGAVIVERTRAHANFAGPRGTFRTGTRGGELSFALDAGHKLAFFILPSRHLELGPPPPGLETPLTTATWLKWDGDLKAPQVNGTALDLSERISWLAVTSDEQSLLLGGSRQLYFFSKSGRRAWQKTIDSSLFQLNLSGDNRLAIAAFGDGTLRWYRTADGEQLLTFFPHIDGQRWIVWTPSGFYDASPGGEDLFGWHVNRGPDQAADFYPAATFRDHFYRPDVIDLIFETLDEAEALRLADERSSSPRG